MKLDVMDKKIIYELEKDSSQTISSIAKKLKRSKEFVNFRIHRLEKEKILLRYGAIVDMAKLGYFTFRIYLRWQNMTDQDKENFYNYIKIKKDIWTTAVLHGKWDFAFFIGSKLDNSIESFHELWDEIRLKYKDKIFDSKIAVYAPVYNFNKKFFIDFKMKTENIERIYGMGIPIKFDDLDLKLIHEYANNVRTPLTEISKNLGITSEAVRQRINHLEQKKVIVGYKIDLDLAKMGFQGYRVDFSLNSTSRNKELFQYLKNNKYFYQINKSIGGADFETEIVVQDLNHLLRILEEIVAKFSNVVKNYEYMGYSGFPSLSIVPD
jgi:Lrp/AsnC family transcriptional regulator, leucine-responsive regulatory protein